MTIGKYAQSCLCDKAIAILETTAQLSVTTALVVTAARYRFLTPTFCSGKNHHYFLTTSMAFIRKHRKGPRIYYEKVRSKRVKGIRNPVQEHLEWLGSYEEAWKRLEQDNDSKLLQSLDRAAGKDKPVSPDLHAVAHQIAQDLIADHGPQAAVEVVTLLSAAVAECCSGKKAHDFPTITYEPSEDNPKP